MKRGPVLLTLTALSIPTGFLIYLFVAERGGLALKTLLVVAIIVVIWRGVLPLALIGSGAREKPR